MPLADFTHPLTPQDRAAALSAAPNPREAGHPVTPAVLLILGAAAAVAAFFLIQSNVLLAALLLIGGTIVAVAAAFMLLTVWLYRRALQSERAVFDRALPRGLARIREFTADAVWAAPPTDEDIGAVLLRLGPDRFAYICMPWVDDAGRGSEDAPLFPAFTRLVTLAGADSIILRVEHGGPSLLVSDELLADDTPDEFLNILHAKAGDGFAVFTLGDLPERWASIVNGASEPA